MSKNEDSTLPRLEPVKSFDDACHMGLYNKFIGRMVS